VPGVTSDLAGKTRPRRSYHNRSFPIADEVMARLRSWQHLSNLDLFASPRHRLLSWYLAPALWPADETRGRSLPW
jgi:hypothetical protein